MTTDRVLRDFTKAPILAATVSLVSCRMTEEIDGATVEGTVSVTVHVRLPVIFPLIKLLQVIVQTPLVALGISLARESGGVQETASPTSEPIKPLALPKR